MKFLVATLVLVSMMVCDARAQLEKPGHDWHAYDEHTPGARHMREANRSYAAGQFASAKSKYKAAAQWADKFAQYNLGVMNLRGEGVEFNPVRAWAWLELAAERGYPEMVEAADSLYDLLVEEQQAEAKRMLEQELLPAYGDEARVEPTAREMRQNRRRATGSRAGGQAFLAFLTVIDSNGQRRRGDEFYAGEKWDFRHIIEFETQLMQAIAQGRVELGDLEIIEDEDDR